MVAQQPAAGMRQVALAEKSLAEYASIVGEDIVAEIETLARPLRGARIAHVSSTAYGGGVAEMLQALVPLMRSAGLHVEWHVLAGTDAFFAVTKRMHNALQGMPLSLEPEMRATYQAVNLENALRFEDGYDFVVVHDPQPAPLRALRPNDGGRWVWRCHIDLTTANPAYWSFLQPYVEEYDAAIYTMPAYASPNLRVGKVAFIPPAIDPLSPKNVPLTSERTAALVSAHGVDLRRPMLVQVSRFDPWKDPVGVIDVYRAVRQEIRDVQLVMLGSLADDDPEGMEYYQRTAAYASRDPDIHLLINHCSSLDVNAFQRRASVILQKSLREGFGLTVAEGMWKERPVVGSRVGGIPLQIEDGVTGYLVDGVEQCAMRVLDVLRAPQAAAELVRRGREHVRQQFLSTTNLRNYLTLFHELTATVA